MFVDTVAWIALVNEDDALHAIATEVLAQLRLSHVELITTELVLLEVADALARPAFRAKTVQFVEGLRRFAFLSIAKDSASLLSMGWDIYRKYHDKDWGWTDCTSFALMQSLGLRVAFTSDHHFEQAGFVILIH